MSPWTALREEARAYYSVSPPCASRLAFNIDVSLSLSLASPTLLVLLFSNRPALTPARAPLLLPSFVCMIPHLAQFRAGPSLQPKYPPLPTAV